MSFGRDDFRPAQQGQVDGFCGVYTILNYFLRRLNLKSDSDESKRIFRSILQQLHNQDQLTYHRICDGFKLEQIQRSFNKVAAKERLNVKAWKLRKVAEKRGVSTPLELISSLDSDEAAMLHLVGEGFSHWALAHTVKEKKKEMKFLLDDSSEERVPLWMGASEVEKFSIGITEGLVFLNA